MLGRTTASLEVYNLNRALSKPRGSTRAGRSLHGGLRQITASAREQEDGSQLQPRTVKSTRRLRTGVTAPAVALPFLYPPTTYPLLHVLHPSFPRLQSRDRVATCSRERYFASTADAEEDESQSRQPSSSSKASKPPSSSSNDEIERAHDDTIRDYISPEPSLNADVSLDLAIRRAQIDYSTPVSRRQTAIRELKVILAQPDTTRWDSIWNLYHALDPSQPQLESLEQRQVLAREVAISLSRSTRVLETGRTIFLARQVAVDYWNHEFLECIVKTYLRTRNHVVALDALKRGLARGILGGVDHFMADAVANGQWRTAIDLWQSYYTLYLAKDPAMKPDPDHLGRETLLALPTLGKLCVEFEQYLTKAKVTADDQAVKYLRRQLPLLALTQPCHPSQATVILHKLNDRDSYHDYLARLFDPDQAKVQRKPNARTLRELYDAYCRFRGSAPPVTVLQGMFDLYWPEYGPQIEKLYEHWHERGLSLNQRAYEQFLKYFARKGDINMVQDLWERYAARYPEAVKSPSGFRSTVNVYVQAGNMALAQNEIDKMRDVYRVQPDVDTWNILLKGYMRVNDTKRVIQCFDAICSRYQPNAFTYSHMMAMYAKQGNLEKTLEIFELAQTSQVQASKEMVLALIMAYCRNGQFVEAENICVELTTRGIASSACWNHLILFHGLEGNLKKCRELLQSMKNYNVDWDSQTLLNMLQAMTKVRRVHDAFHLLKRAQKERLVVVGPEHYAVVLRGAARMGDFLIVQSTLSYMKDVGQQMSFNAQVGLVESLCKKLPSDSEIKVLTRGLVKYLQETAPHRDSDKFEPERKGNSNSRSVSNSVTGDIRVLRSRTQGIGRAITLLLDLDDFDTAEELINLYTEIFPDYQQQKTSLPPHVVSAIMEGYLKNKKYEEVHRWWRHVRENVGGYAEVSEKGGIRPAFRYHLSRPLHVVIRALKEQVDGRGLRTLINDVALTGFQLTNVSWDLAVRSLAELGQWDEAMLWCESMLMPAWRGWNRHDTPEQKRNALNSRIIRGPSNSTVVELQNHWLEMRHLSAWSSEVSSKLQDISKEFPRLHYAFIMSTAQQLQEGLDKSGDDSQRLRKLVQKLVSPYGARDIILMRRILRKRLFQSLVDMNRRSLKEEKPTAKFSGLHDLDTVLSERINELKPSRFNQRFRPKEEATSSQPGQEREWLKSKQSASTSWEWLKSNQSASTIESEPSTSTVESEPSTSTVKRKPSTRTVETTEDSQTTTT